METTQIEWKHPVKGEIVEEVCREHEKEVLSALRTLGIGCGGTYGKLGICWRCIYSGMRFRDWMDQIDMDGYFD